MGPIHFIWFTHASGTMVPPSHSRGTAARHIGRRDTPATGGSGPHRHASESLRQVIQEAEGLLGHGNHMKLMIKADKFTLLHYKPSTMGLRCAPSQHRVGGHAITAKRKGEYVRLFGGNANWCGSGSEALALMRRLSWRVQARATLCKSFIKVLWVLVKGVVINAWVSRHIVQLPPHVLGC